jgi:putative tryptophan/tyrosine transport system substrate-binding protein
MKRRDFIAGLGSAVAWPPTAQAQRDGGVRRIGVLINTVENDLALQADLNLLRETLAKLGWIEGRNLRIDLRWGAGDLGRLDAHARELVSLAPAVIVADAGAATRATQRATQTIPIVYLVGGDPVIVGLVRDIARPEGNVTGFYGVQPSLAGKWLELLKQAAPNVTRVAVLYNSELLSTQMRSAYMSVIAAAGSALSIQVNDTPVRDPFTIVRAIDAFATEPNGGLIVLPTTTVGANRDTILHLTEQHRLPAIYSTGRGLIEAGGLMSYGADAADRVRSAASYVDRLLRGAKVSDLPVQFPTKFGLLINLKTAKALGLTIPDTLLATADEVIQ